MNFPRKDLIYLTFSLIILLISSPTYAQNQDDVFIEVEKVPQLKGGISGLQEKLYYPFKAKKAGIEGRVFVQFVVNKRGKVENPKVVRGIGGGCDKEALRIVKTANFTPGMQNGKPVKVKFTLIFLFHSNLPVSVPFAVKINSNPQGATIYLNDFSSSTGKTPKTLTINPGVHKLKLLKKGYVSVEKQIRVTKENKSFNFPLIKQIDVLKNHISNKVTKRIENWQQKGKYESTQAYRERVTERKRAELIQQYTTNLVDSLGRAKFDADITKTDYDADNRVFEVTFADRSTIYVNVPVSEAQAFDRNLSRLRFSNMDFTLTGGELVLRKAQIHNPANEQTYAYDSDREVAFNTAELAANSDPIDVEIRTEDVGANVTKGTKKIEVGKADVDVNIPKTAMSKPDGIAVVIGNRRYQGDTPDVDYAVNDAKVMRKYLIKTLGFRPGNILYVENASKSRMEVLLGDDKNQGKLANYLKPRRSDVFVFYSGHGAPDPNTETGYLIPVDGDASALNITGYPLEVLYDNLAQLDAKSVSVVIDACFSGASGGGEMLVDKASPIGIEIKNPAAKLDDGFVVTASSGSQISSWYPEKGHGLLTYFWLKALQGEADQDGNKSITASEIRTYLNDNSDGLPYWARRLHNREQTPQVFTNNNKNVIVEYK